MYLTPFKNFTYTRICFRTGQALRREENKAMKSFEGSFSNLNFSPSTSILLNSFFPFIDIRCFFLSSIKLAPRDFLPRKDSILYHPPPVGLSWDSPPSPAESVRTEGRNGRTVTWLYVTTKISQIDRLPNLLSNGAPLADFARRLRYYRENIIKSLCKKCNFYS